MSRSWGATLPITCLLKCGLLSLAFIYAHRRFIVSAARSAPPRRRCCSRPPPGKPRHGHPEEPIEAIRWQHNFHQFHPPAGKPRRGEERPPAGSHPVRGGGWARAPGAQPPNCGGDQGKWMAEAGLLLLLPRLVLLFHTHPLFHGSAFFFSSLAGED